MKEITVSLGIVILGFIIGILNIFISLIKYSDRKVEKLLNYLAKKGL